LNIEEIDKWLDNEYGMSYTKLEELHDYFFEKYTDQKEEIERLNNIIDKAIEYIDRRDIEWGSEEHNKLFTILKGSDKE
jgi:diphthamide biosynthesis methyltransferase